MLITPDEFNHFIISVATILYWGKFSLFITCVTLIVFFISSKKYRWWFGLLTALVCSAGYVIPDIIKARKHHAVVKKVHDKAELRYQTAASLFDEKCKTAGEKIYRTVDDVEGVTLLKVMQEKSAERRVTDVYNPMWEDAALQRMDDDYIVSFLGITTHDKPLYYGVYWLPEKNEKNSIVEETFKPLYGYRFVDVKEEKNYFRYSLNIGHRAKKNRVPIETPSRYAVTYNSPINPNERKNWIATTVIKVLDTQTNEILGEKTIVAFDRALGSGSERGMRTGAGRQPWSFAILCPKDEVYGNAPRFFAEKVLKPKQPNININNGE